MNILIFSLGASLGAPIRFWIDCKLRPKYKFPFSIFLVNIAGSFLIGFYANHMNYFVVGFCGALTTWSTFITDVYFGITSRGYRLGLINLSASLILGVLAFKFGISLRSA